MTTYYVGQHYEKKGTTVTKYYFAGATRLAVRTNGTLSYLLGDHLGSSSVTVNASGVKTASALYRAFGETRYREASFRTPPALSARTTSLRVSEMSKARVPIL